MIEIGSTYICRISDPDFASRNGERCRVFQELPNSEEDKRMGARMFMVKFADESCIEVCETELELIATGINATFVMVKPDGVKRGLVGECIRRFEQKGLVIRGMHLLDVPKSWARLHYEQHSSKPFFRGLVEALTAGPAVILWLELRGDQEIVFPAWKCARDIVGDTNGTNPGTIRGDFSFGLPNTVVHASDSAESAENELNLWFNRELRDQVPSTERTVDRSS